MKNPLDIRAKVAKASEKGPGTAPGLLVAPEGSPPPRMDGVVWGPETATCTRDLSLEDLQDLWRGLEKGRNLWLDVNGLGNAALIAEVGAVFGLHRLAVEDAMSPHQAPKVQSYGEELFTVLQVPGLGGEGLEFEQVSLWLGPRFLITMQAKRASALENLYARFDARAARVMQSGPDYLFYVAVDTLVDTAFPVLEHFDARADFLEERLLERSTPELLEEIHDLRREGMILRRLLFAQTRVPDILLKPGLELLDVGTLPYLRDVQDHAQRALGRAEHLRDTSTALMDLQRSVAGNQMNEVMKVLTIISTLFIPLTFIAGVYGMNFDPEASPWNMPELDWFYGYPFAWGLMLLSVAGMLILFRRKGWL